MKKEAEIRAAQDKERERSQMSELEAERDRRVQHLQQLGVKRLMQQGLARGWSAWYDLYEEHVRKRNLLKAAGARLSRPKLVAMFMHWQKDWDAVQAEIAAKAAQAKVDAANQMTEATRSQMETEIRRLKALVAAAEEKALASSNNEAEHQRQMEAQLENCLLYTSPSPRDRG